MRRFMIGLIATAMLMIGLAPATARASTHSCAAKNSKTVRWVGNVRIFTREKTANQTLKYKATYACSKRYGKRFMLRAGQFTGEDEYSDYVVAGRFLGYVHFSPCATECPGIHATTVLDLSNGHTNAKTRRTYPPGGPFPTCTGQYDGCEIKYERFLLRRTGSYAVAFSARDVPANTATQRVIEKHELGSALASENVTMLDLVGNRNDLRSLKLDGDLLTWMNAGLKKQAQFK